VLATTMEEDMIKLFKKACTGF